MPLPVPLLTSDWVIEKCTLTVVLPSEINTVTDTKKLKPETHDQYETPKCSPLSLLKIPLGGGH